MPRKLRSALIPATCHPEKQHYARGLCNACYMRDWHATHPGKQREYADKQDYGLTAAESAVLRGIKSCAICHRTSEERRLVIDHNHATGAIRGILCDHCNRAIGLIGDDANALRRAAGYVYNDGNLHVGRDQGR